MAQLFDLIYDLIYDLLQTNLNKNVSKTHHLDIVWCSSSRQQLTLFILQPHIISG